MAHFEILLISSKKPGSLRFYMVFAWFCMVLHTLGGAGFRLSYYVSCNIISLDIMMLCGYMVYSTNLGFIKSGSSSSANSHHFPGAKKRKRTSRNFEASPVGVPIGA